MESSHPGMTHVSQGRPQFASQRAEEAKGQCFSCEDLVVKYRRKALRMQVSFSKHPASAGIQVLPCVLRGCLAPHCRQQTHLPPGRGRGTVSAGRETAQEALGRQRLNP